MSKEPIEKLLRRLKIESNLPIMDIFIESIYEAFPRLQDEFYLLDSKLRALETKHEELLDYNQQCKNKRYNMAKEIGKLKQTVSRFAKALIEIDQDFPLNFNECYHCPTAFREGRHTEDCPLLEAMKTVGENSENSRPK